MSEIVVQSKFLVEFLCCQVVIGLSQIPSFFSWICFMIISNGSIRRTATSVGAQRLREESHLPFFILSRLRKVSYLAVSVRLTVKQVQVNKCVVQYDWSMIFKGLKGQSNDAIHNRYV